MKWHHLLTILSASILMASCGANPTTDEASIAQSHTPRSGQSLIYVYWPSDVFSTAATTRVSINRKSKGELPNGSFMCLQMAAGEHQLLVGSQAAKLHAQPNKCYYFKVKRSAKQQGSMMYGSMLYPILVFSSTPDSTEETVARSEIKKCRQVAVGEGESSNIKIIPE
ncbi:MAG: DUF2846 domain-containing protein [Verrucomicrobiota bacterium]